MTTMGSRPGPDVAGTVGGLRVSDAERDRAVIMLQDAYTDGRIDHEELDRRIGSVLVARERAELSEALRGLAVAGSAFTPANDWDGPVRPGSVRSGQPSRPGRPAGSALSRRPESLERSWAFVAHWIGFLTLFVGPMVIAVTKGGTSRFVRDQAWEAANFHLTFLAANVVLGVVTAATLGLASFLFAPLGMLWFVLTVIGGLSAAAGNQFRYPWSLRIFG